MILLQVREWPPVRPRCVHPAALWDLGPDQEQPWLCGWSSRPPGSCSWGACRGGGRCQGSLWAATLSTCGVGGPRCLSRQLLQHECPQCPELPPFGLFGDLEQHMRKQHELFCCKLCLKHLKVRPGESRAWDLGPWVFVCPPPALLSHTRARQGGAPGVCAGARSGGRLREPCCRGAAGRGWPVPSTLFPTDIHVRAQMVLAQGPGAAPHAGGPRRHVTPRAPALQVL